MQTVAITNQKGGVGKTTTAHILSAGLMHRGLRVLAVDLDPQANLTFTAGLEPEAETDIYDLFKRTHPTQSAIQTVPAGFDMIPGSLGLAGADMEFTQPGREHILKELLEAVEGQYDYCVIDTPPTLGILTINALTAAGQAIIPMEADVYSVQGLAQLQGIIGNVRRYCNPGLSVEGLLLTRYNPRAVVSKTMTTSIEEIAKNLDTKVFASRIRETVAIKELHLMRGDVFSEYPKHNVTKDYAAFLDELMKEV